MGAGINFGRRFGTTANRQSNLWWSGRWCRLSTTVCSISISSFLHVFFIRKESNKCRFHSLFLYFSPSLPFSRAVVRELIETEEEFGRDLMRVVDKYIKTVENSKPPKIITDNKDLIFGNFKQITEFHNTLVQMLESIQFNPFISYSRLGERTFVRWSGNLAFESSGCGLWLDSARTKNTEISSFLNRTWLFFNILAFFRRPCLSSSKFPKVVHQGGGHGQSSVGGS